MRISDWSSDVCSSDLVSGEYLKADISLIDEQEASGTQVQALMRSVAEQFEQYVRLNKKIAPDIPVQVGQIEEPSRLADAGAAHLNRKVSDKPTRLSTFDTQQRRSLVFAFIEGTLGVSRGETK